MNISSKKYSAKLLLLGEYTIIEGGSALAFPLSQYFGAWDTTNQDPSLLDFYGYLKQKNYLDQEKLTLLIDNPLAFKSNIPYGYGLGSSGVLAAAVYDFCKLDTESELTKLKSRLADMESFFHGSSSGFDPLTSYVGNTIISENGDCSVVTECHLPKGIFLFDSLQRRDTKKMVEVFWTKKEDETFKNVLVQLDKLNDKAIRTIKIHEPNGLEACFREISQLQYKHFKEMIPSHVDEFWMEGLASGRYSLKLSGAGGGGFFVGLSHDGEIEETIPLS